MDFVRWVAALIVVISHAGGPLLVALSAQQPHERPAPQYIYSFIAGFSHHAVIVFFVLSGYFVGGAHLRAKQAGGGSAMDYFSKRLIRLWIVLIPMLFLSYILYKVGYHFSPEVYLGRKDNHVDGMTLACNAFFLQNAFCGRFASNDSLWSIFNEFWYYVIFYFMAEVAFSKGARALAAFAVFVTVAAVLSYHQFANAPLMPYFLIWLMGVWVAIADKPVFVPRLIPFVLLLAALLVGARIFLGPHKMHGTTLISFVTDVAVGIIFSMLILRMKFSSKLPPPPLGRANSIFAGFSYSLYCLHLPLVLFYSAVVYYFTGRGYEMIPSSVVDWGLVIGCLFFAVAGAYVFSVCTEAHTVGVRNFLFKRIKSDERAAG